MPHEPGQMISHYRLVEWIGEGGMGVVWKAVDTRLDRPVAIKILPEAVARDAERLQRFRREARVLASLNHPNIVTIHSVEEADGVPFLTMEFVEGETLERHLPGGGLALETFLDLAIRITDALRAAHDGSVIHRDLKPANIMLGGDRRLKVLDFGLARFEEQETLTECAETATRDVTKDGVLVGTMPYMSPEQIQGKTVDHRSDIFSLGIVLYRMATGRHPFPGKSWADLVTAILRDDPAAPQTLNPALPRPVDRMILRCLEKDPGRRYQATADLLHELEETEREGGARAAGRGPSIAVLPFADMSPDKDQDYFCEGMADEILNALTKIKGLHVASRTSSFQFKATAADSQEIGRRLGVSTFVEGSVRKAGDRLRITAQLINAGDGYHLWSERYDRELKDVFAIQDEIAEALADTLKVKLMGERKAPAAKARTPDLEAYNLNLKGRYFWSKRTEEGLRKGIEYFERAIEKDPLYAAAHASLADSYSLLCCYHLLSPAESIPRATAAAKRALELDGTLAEGYEALAHVRFLYEWSWSEAEADLARAIELNPGFATARQRRAILLTVLDRLDDSMAEIRRAEELDPLSLIINTDTALIHYIGGHHDAALKQCNRVLEMSPGFGVALFTRGLACERLGRHEDAIEAFRQAIEVSGMVTVMTGALGHAYAVAGRTDEARATLGRLESLAETRYVSPYSVATVHAGLGQTDEALAWLERAVSDRSVWLIHLHMKADPRLDVLRSHPRFATLLGEMSLDG